MDTGDIHECLDGQTNVCIHGIALKNKIRSGSTRLTLRKAIVKSVGGTKLRKIRYYG